jgi:protein-S-isoprenylcysteine O-methyltransferase Ste14
VALVVAALVGTFVAQLDLGQSWRIGVDEGERTELITRRSFSIVRNPIFTWMATYSIGVAVALYSPLALLGAVMMIAGIELQARRVEEPYLLRVHGAVYRRYGQTTGRFVPGVGLLRADAGGR